MMPDIRRLKTRREFLRVAAARRKCVRPGVVVQAARRRTSSTWPAKSGKGTPCDSGPSRGARGTIGVGFTASRKVGRAVDRNRARRRLRAVAAEVIPALGQVGTDYVLVARKETLNRSYADLVRDLREALSRLSYESPRKVGTGRCRTKATHRSRTSASGERT